MIERFMPSLGGAGVARALGRVLLAAIAMRPAATAPTGTTGAPTSGGPGAGRALPDGLNTAFVYEAAFTPGVTDFWYMLRSAAGKGGGAGTRYRAWSSLGRLRLWKGGVNPLEAALHESWHGVQYDAMPMEYLELNDLRTIPDRAMSPWEFSEVDTPLNPADIAGAHDFAVQAKPPNALSPAVLVSLLPVAYAAGRHYRR